MADVDVSVVVPTRNRVERLSRTVRSVLDQRGSATSEVIVVDEASTDGTAEWLSSLDDPRVRVHRNPTPTGVAAARNSGIALARGEWLAFVDDDDLWAPDKLRAQLDALTSNAGARWSAVGSVSIDEGGRLLRADDVVGGDDLAKRLLGANVIPGGASGVVADASLVRSLGGFDGSLAVCADWDLWIRLALASPLAPVHEAMVAYLVHTTSMSFDVGTYRRECRHVDAKYAADRARLGTVVDPAVRDRWVARQHARAGRRVRAAATHARIALSAGQVRELGDALAVLCRPARASARRDMSKSASIPAAWRAEVERWLPPAL